MKKILLLMVAIVCATMSYAQTLVATLTHGDEIQMFYGAFAFQNAFKAAENGDVINLSGGGFQSIAITKAVTVRGTGVDDANPTYITGDFDINIPEGVTERLTFEGCRISNTITIKSTLQNSYFLKNNVYEVNVQDGTGVIKNGNFVNCKLDGMDLRGKSSVTFLNSYVNGFTNNAENDANAGFVNCVIRVWDGARGTNIRSSHLINSILVYDNNYMKSSLPITSSAQNCVAIGYDRAYQEIKSAINCRIANMDIFQESDKFKDLTEEAKKEYLGNDGTPVGMYGGILPYDTTPTYPRITKMNVANKTTADGKLSVEIEVSAAQ